MTDSGEMPSRLVELDSLQRCDHVYLDASDECYYIFEYRAGEGYKIPQNQLIFNLKKSMDKKGKPEWVHKIRVIREVAQILARTVPQSLTTDTVWVPAPSSIPASDPLHDPRLSQVLTTAKSMGAQIVQLTLLDRNHTVTQAHKSAGNRPKPADHRKSIGVNGGPLQAGTRTIVLFDDVLTTGCMFVACKELLQARHPGVAVKGVFVARTIHATA
jgi:hypothetical protein